MKQRITGWLLIFGLVAACTLSAEVEPRRIELETVLEARLDTIPVAGVIVLDEGRWIVAAYLHNTIATWKIGETEPSSRQQVDDRIVGFDHLHGSNEIFVATEGGTVWLWDSTLSTERFKHTFPYNARYAAASPDGQFFSLDGEIGSRTTRQLLTPAAGHAVASGAAYSAGRFLSSGFIDESLVLRTPPETALLRIMSPDKVRTSDLSPSGEDVVAATEDGRLLLWRIAATTKPSEVAADTIQPIAKVRIGQTTGFFFSPNGEALLVGTPDNQVRTYSVPMLELKSTLRLEAAVTASDNYSPTGVALGLETGEVVLYDFERDQMVAKWQAASSMITAISADSEHGLIALGTDEGRVLVYRGKW